MRKNSRVGRLIREPYATRRRSRTQAMGGSFQHWCSGATPATTPTTSRKEWRVGVSVNRLNGRVNR
jgi:hypothetical protein